MPQMSSLDWFILSFFFLFLYLILLVLCYYLVMKIKIENKFILMDDFLNWKMIW